METCVLIPSEFSLMLRPKDSYLHLINGLKNIKSRHQNATEKKTETESGVCVYSNQLIRKGTCFLPFQGTIRLDRLEVYSLLNDDDVSSNNIIDSFTNHNLLEIKKKNFFPNHHQSSSFKVCFFLGFFLLHFIISDVHN